MDAFLVQPNEVRTSVCLNNDADTSTAEQKRVIEAQAQAACHRSKLPKYQGMLNAEATADDCLYIEKSYRMLTHRSAIADIRAKGEALYASMKDVVTGKSKQKGYWYVYLIIAILAAVFFFGLLFYIFFAVMTFWQKVWFVMTLLAFWMIYMGVFHLSG